MPDLINARKKIACRFGVRAKLYAIQEHDSENNSSSLMSPMPNLGMMSPMPKFGSGSVHDSEDKDKGSPRSKVQDVLSESSRYDGSVLSMPNIEVVKPSSKNLVF